MKTGVVLLNWNGAEFTIPCLESLYAAQPPPWRVLVVDNGSTDGSPDAIATRFPETPMLRLPTNTGFAAGNNAGIRRLLAEGAETLWILNNDTVVDPLCLSELQALLEREPDVGVATGRILLYDTPGIIWYAGGELNPLTLTVTHRGFGEEDKRPHGVEKDTAFVTGCCMLVRREVWERVGLFDERFFAYCEDVDWCLRAARAGVRMRYTPAAVLRHRASASVRKNAFQRKEGTVSPLAHYFDARNRLFLLRLHAGRPAQAVAGWSFYAGYSLWILSGHLLKGRWAKLAHRLRGMCDGVLTKLDSQG